MVVVVVVVVVVPLSMSRSCRAVRRSLPVSSASLETRTLASWNC